MVCKERGFVVPLFFMMVTSLFFTSILPHEVAAADQSSAEAVDWKDLCNNFNTRTDELDATSKSALANACSVYLKGYEQGVAAMTPTEDEYRTIYAICDRFVKAAVAGGGSSALEQELQQGNYSPEQRLKIIQSCGDYKEGYSSGLKYARELFSK